MARQQHHPSLIFSPKKEPPPSPLRHSGGMRLIRPERGGLSRLGQAEAPDRETDSEQTGAKKNECRRFRNRRMPTGTRGSDVEVSTIDAVAADRKLHSRLPDTRAATKRSLNA